MQNELTPIGHRVATLLTQRNESGSWLAKRAGVDRATVSRVLDGSRNPSLETLELCAAVFGITVDQLVEGTDAYGRTIDAKKVVNREHYQEAVNELLAAKSQVLDLTRKVRDLEISLKTEEDRRRRAENESDKLRYSLNTTDREKRAYASEAEQYRLAFHRAQKETAQLQGKLAELAEEVRSGKKTGQVALGMASIAAAAALANLFKEESK